MGLSRKDSRERAGVQCLCEEGLGLEAQATARVLTAGKKNLTDRFSQAIKTIGSKAKNIWTQRKVGGQ